MQQQQQQQQQLITAAGRAGSGRRSEDPASSRASRSAPPPAQPLSGLTGLADAFPGTLAAAGAGGAPDMTHRRLAALLAQYGADAGQGDASGDLVAAPQARASRRLSQPPTGSASAQMQGPAPVSVSDAGGGLASLAAGAGVPLRSRHANGPPSVSRASAAIAASYAVAIQSLASLPPLSGEETSAYQPSSGAPRRPISAAFDAPHPGGGSGSQADPASAPGGGRQHGPGKRAATVSFDPFVHRSEPTFTPAPPPAAGMRLARVNSGRLRPAPQ